MASRAPLLPSFPVRHALRDFLKMGLIVGTSVASVCFVSRNFRAHNAVLESSHHAWLPEVKDLRLSHDTMVPAAVPLAIGFLAALVYGLTNFGEAVVFVLLWNISGHLGFLGTDYSFAKGVLFSIFVAVLALPYNLWVARHEIRACLGWCFTGILFSCAMVPFGVHCLIFSTSSLPRWIVACMFCVFAPIKAAQSALAFGRARAASGESKPHDDDVTAYGLDDNETVVLSSSEHWQPHWSIVEDTLQRVPALRRPYEAILPRISESNYSIETAFLVLSIGNILGGFMQGLSATSGPPKMAVYGILRLTKGSMRALSCTTWIIGMVMSMMYLSSASEMHVLMKSELHIYIGLAITGFLGNIVGVRLREFTSRDHILFCFYILIWGDAALLLDVFDTTSGCPILPSHIIIASAVLAMCLAACYFHAAAVDDLIGSMQGTAGHCCSARSNQPIASLPSTTFGNAGSSASEHDRLLG